MRPILVPILIGSFLLPSALSAIDPSPSSPPLTLGLLAPPDQPDALSVRQGATLAIAQLNHGQAAPVRLIVRGRAGQWGTDSDEAAVLALDDEVAALITPSSGTVAHQILQIAGRTRLPVVSLCPDSSITRAGVPWAVRIVPRTDQEAESIFSGLQRQDHRPGPLRWAALVPPGRPGREASRDLAAAARAAGCQLAEPIPMPSDTTNGRSLLGSFLTNPPDALLLWTDPSAAAAFARDLRALGFHGTLAGPARLCSDSFRSLAGNAALGCVIPALVRNAEEERDERQFDMEYTQQFGSRPDFDARMGRDAVILLSNLLSDSRSSGGEPVFPIGSSHRCTSGTFRFDKQGNRLLRLTLLVCTESGFVPLESVRSGSEAIKERSL